MEILGLNDSFEVCWCFGKANVILDYKICYDGIKILDDEKKLYKIDFDGNLLEEYPEDWATSTLKENYFWKAWMSPEEYEIEREYYTKNYTTLFLIGKYKPLWKQAEEEKDVK